MSKPAPAIQLRPPQEEVFASLEGILFLIWRRQLGKSYTLANVALNWMMESVCSVFIVSAAIRLGMENVRKEAEVWRSVMATLRRRAEAAGYRLTVGQAADDKGALLDVDAIADLFENSKLETKLWHNRSEFSRSMVIAPNPDTAVGWTGHLILDEVGRMPEFRDVWEAVEPIVSSNPQFRVRGATTPPPDDSHYSYEMLAPLLEEFPVNARGNFYRSKMGHLCHRCDAWDAYAGGVPIYDLASRLPLSPDEARAKSPDKAAWDRNYGCRFISGGTAALSIMALKNAMSAGAGLGCVGLNITDELVA